MNQSSMAAIDDNDVPCDFYSAIGACDLGDDCPLIHIKPDISRTLLFSNLYQPPAILTPEVHPDDLLIIQRHFEEFYEDLFDLLNQYGEIETLIVCDNLCDHMVGNVYVQFREEEDAAYALNNLSERFYDGRPIIVEFSTATIRGGICKKHRESRCVRGGYCNFIHLKEIDPALRLQLFGRSINRHSYGGSRFSPGGSSGCPGGSSGSSGGGSGSSGGGSGSSGVIKAMSPLRERSAERRATIEEWNRERQKAVSGPKNDVLNYDNDRNSDGLGELNEDLYEDSHQKHSSRFCFGFLALNVIKFFRSTKIIPLPFWFALKDCHISK